MAITDHRAPAHARIADTPASGKVVAFVVRYGWRAYALPILTVVTVIALMGTGNPTRSTAQRGPARPAAAGPQVPLSLTPTATPRAPSVAPAPPTAPGAQQLKTDTPRSGSNDEALAESALPAGADYTQQGAGTFRVVSGTGPVVGTGRIAHYTVEIEDGVTGIDAGVFAAKVDATLADPRSWARPPKAGTGLQRVSSGPIDFHITLTSSLTVRALCGYELPIETSCWAPDKGRRVVLNVARWVRGDASYVGDIDAYRAYMVNHESGHALGHGHVMVCLPNGLAPVMMQQTITLKASNGQLCQANPWPYPSTLAELPRAG